MGNREEAIDNKEPRELFKSYGTLYLSEMFIHGLNIRDKHNLCLPRLPHIRSCKKCCQMISCNADGPKSE